MIFFNRSSVEGEEIRYIKKAITSGRVSGNHVYGKKGEALLQKVLGVPRALITTSCTHALEMTALLLNIQKDDEFIVPSFTFVSTANAFVLRGARPIFCDIRPDTLNLDESKLEALITKRTRAILVVHYAGIGCEMETILKIARRHDVPVVEDNAHGLFGRYRGKLLGTFGAMAALSFHETKNITCGEGGALLLNEKRYIQRAEMIREKGTDRSKFDLRQVKKYSWIEVGSSYVMSDVLAAFLLGQLEKWQDVQQKRKKIWLRYEQRLGKWAQRHGVRQPYVPKECEQAYHMYYLLMPFPEAREHFIAHLARHKIKAVFHYLPLHKSPFIKKNYPKKPTVTYCPESERASQCLVRLPFYNKLSEKNQSKIIQAIIKFNF